MRQKKGFYNIDACSPVRCFVSAKQSFKLNPEQKKNFDQMMGQIDT
jgi:hypothetical protein